ncbi:hypothetical protein ACQPUY_16915 [Clostridium nigeriense]|uniref:hypothetical protein n=1 Tax=Clostridium nigeriense TaxID=1805470 RepID=UPI003D33203F
MLFSIDSVTLADEEFKDEIIVKPTKITLIKDVTEDEYIIPLENSVGIDKLADKIIKEINKQTRTTIKLDGVNINRFKER